jgi:DNA-binding HxlR family transcriptional regulator
VTDDGITSRVKQLITEHLDSVMQLEVLLLLAGGPGKVWTAPDLAQQLRIDAAWVDGQLRTMTAGGLVAVSEQSGPAPAQYRFAPRTPELAQAVSELADRRVTVIGLIFAKPTDKLRSFADAFRIRKDRTD